MSDEQGAENTALETTTSVRERAVMALLVEPTIARAAQTAGISERTLYRWMREDEDFKTQYRLAKREAFGQAVNLCQRLAPAAIHALAKVMTDPMASANAKVAAASAILKFGSDAIELEDITERLDRIERKVAETPVIG
jgi:transposase-like protein